MTDTTTDATDGSTEGPDDPDVPHDPSSDDPNTDDPNMKDVWDSVLPKRATPSQVDRVAASRPDGWPSRPSRCPTSSSTVRAPPPMPNGWYALAASERRGARASPSTVIALERELVLFRGEDGSVHVLDAHCPHMGAHLGGGEVLRRHAGLPVPRVALRGRRRGGGDPLQRRPHPVHGLRPELGRAGALRHGPVLVPRRRRGPHLRGARRVRGGRPRLQRRHRVPHRAGGIAAGHGREQRGLHALPLRARPGGARRLDLAVQHRRSLLHRGRVASTPRTWSSPATPTDRASPCCASRA